MTKKKRPKQDPVPGVSGDVSQRMYSAASRESLISNASTARSTTSNNSNFYDELDILVRERIEQEKKRTYEMFAAMEQIDKNLPVEEIMLRESRIQVDNIYPELNESEKLEKINELMETRKSRDQVVRTPITPDNQPAKKLIVECSHPEPNVNNLNDEIDSMSDSDSLMNEEISFIPKNNFSQKETISLKENKIEYVVTQKKPKPITVAGIVDPIKFNKKIESVTDAEYEIKMAGKFLRVYPKSLDDKTKLIKIFKENNIPHYFNEDRTPVRKFVIRGLYKSFPKDEIISKLTNEGHEVFALSQMKSKRNDQLLPLFLVQIVRKQSTREVLKINSICRIRVVIEDFRSPKKATQCYKCQHFFHIAANCNMLPRCVVCGEDHESYTCPVKQNPEKPKEASKCCNCGGNHPSSYKGCKNFPTKQQSKKSYSDILKNKDNNPTKEQKFKKVKGNPPITKVRENVTEELYSVQEFTGNISSLVDVIQNLKKQLNTDSLAEILIKFQNVLKVVTQQKDHLSKALAFAEEMNKNFSSDSRNTDGATASAGSASVGSASAL